MRSSSDRSRGRALALVVALLGTACARPSCSGSGAPSALDRELLEATKAGDVAAVEAVLSRGGNVNVRDEDGLSPLAWAALQGNPRLVEALLRAHADPRTRDNEGLTPLHRAVQGKGPVEAKQPDMVRQLLRAGADPNASSERGVTPLMLVGDNVEVARLLREGGADVSIRDGNGRTALMVSGFSCAPSTTRLLLEAGARKDDRAKNDHSPRDFAREGMERQVGICEANLRGLAGSLSDGGLEAGCARIRAECETTLKLLE